MDDLEALARDALKADQDWLEAVKMLARNLGLSTEVGRPAFQLFGKVSSAQAFFDFGSGWAECTLMYRDGDNPLMVAEWKLLGLTKGQSNEFLTTKEAIDFVTAWVGMIKSITAERQQELTQIKDAFGPLMG